MKPLTLFIIVFVFIVGFVFLKDESGGTQSVQSEIRMDQPGYREYSDAALATAQKKGAVILFFAATRWCQTCAGLEREITQRSAQLPPGVTILKVDYDNDRTMNRNYAVTTQHTLVLLDRNGGEITRWVGGGFDTLLRHLQQI